MTTTLTLVAAVLAGVAAGLLAGQWQHRRTTARLAAAAHTDPLTGLLNRAGIGARVDEALTYHPAAGLLLVDLDDFKPVNDTHGHRAGDLVLTVVAERTRAALLPGEHAARHGGDEFSVLLTVAETPWARRRAAAVATAITGPVRLPSGRVVQVGASVGHAIASDSVALWEAADDAMYAVKRVHHTGRTAVA